MLEHLSVPLNEISSHFPLAGAGFGPLVEAMKLEHVLAWAADVAKEVRALWVPRGHIRSPDSLSCQLVNEVFERFNSTKLQPKRSELLRSLFLLYNPKP